MPPWATDYKRSALTTPTRLPRSSPANWCSDAKAVYVIGQDAFLQRGNTAVHFGSGTTAKVMRVLPRSLRRPLQAVLG